MKKSVPPSENSDAQRVEDHQTSLSVNNASAALSRAKSSWKRMKDLAAEKEKENEAKRPPWRAVSVSTLPKPDKNALLRAKLLDASRRLRAGKSNVAVQTDFVPTKLMKEVAINAQEDLILCRDIGILTDGQYLIRKDEYQQYILTYCVSQMTDDVDKAEVSTQTVLPTALEHRMGNSRLLELKDHDVSSQEKSHNNKTVQENSLFSSNASGALDIGLNSTLSSWRFDDESIRMECKSHFIPYTIEPRKPWRSFRPIPFYLSSSTSVGRQKIDWFLLLKSIDELIVESNNLMDLLQNIIEQKRIQYQRVHETLHEVPKFQAQNFVLPSEHWLPIIEEQELQLKILMENTPN